MKKLVVAFSVVVYLIAGNWATANEKKLPNAVDNGAELYNTYCANCHMQDGKGLDGVYPSLIKSANLLQSTKKPILSVLKGQSGSIINNVKYETPMPAQDFLTDDQIAQVLNYSRNSWGNKSVIKITPAMVKALRN